MFRVIKKHTRPATTVAFFGEGSGISTEYYQYFRENYISSGKFLSREVTLSDDSLEETSTLLYSDAAAAAQYLADQVVIDGFLTPQQAYFDANNIQTVKVSAETI
jgi:hypothetical protein